MAFIKIIAEFIVKLMSLIGEDVPSFITDWLASLETEEDSTEGTVA